MPYPTIAGPLEGAGMKHAKAPALSRTRLSHRGGSDYRLELPEPVVEGLFGALGMLEAMVAKDEGLVEICVRAPSFPQPAKYATPPITKNATRRILRMAPIPHELLATRRSYLSLCIKATPVVSYSLNSWLILSIPHFALQNQTRMNHHLEMAKSLK